MHKQSKDIGEAPSNFNFRHPRLVRVTDAANDAVNESAGPSDEIICKENEEGM